MDVCRQTIVFNCLGGKNPTAHPAFLLAARPRSVPALTSEFRHPCASAGPQPIFHHSPFHLFTAVRQVLSKYSALQSLQLDRPLLGQQMWLPAWRPWAAIRTRRCCASRTASTPGTQREKPYYCQAGVRNYTTLEYLCDIGELVPGLVTVAPLLRQWGDSNNTVEQVRTFWSAGGAI